MPRRFDEPSAYLARALRRARLIPRQFGEAPERAGLRVHLLTSPVAQVLSANVLLAIGVTPSATPDVASMPAFVRSSDALLVNLGMLEPARAAAQEAAIAAARELGRPWVLDPVKVDRDPRRRELALRLLELRPSVLKANRGEIEALAGEAGDAAAIALARRTGCIVAMTGARDLVTDGRRTVRIGGSSALMTRATAMGCALGAVLAAYLAAHDDRFEATVLALAAYAVAGSLAERRAHGPGTFQPALLDALAGLTRADLLAHADVTLARSLDLRLYGVLDPALCRDRPLPELAAAAARGGITLLQLRDKTSDTRRLVEQARSVGAALAPFGVSLLINDRVDVAQAAEVDGAHVGRSDLEPAAARALLGLDAILGVTIHHGFEAADVPTGVGSYAGLGPVFATQSKDPRDPPLGPGGLARLIREVRQHHPALPVCGIAGITAENAASVIEAGADGVAVISAIFMADDVERAARRLRAVVDEALAGRALDDRAPSDCVPTGAMAAKRGRA